MHCPRDANRGPPKVVYHTAYEDTPVVEWYSVGEAGGPLPPHSEDETSLDPDFPGVVMIDGEWRPLADIDGEVEGSWYPELCGRGAGGGLSALELAPFVALLKTPSCEK